MGRLRCLETSVPNQSTLRNNPEERRSHNSAAKGWNMELLLHADWRNDSTRLMGLARVVFHRCFSVSYFMLRNFSRWYIVVNTHNKRDAPPIFVSVYTARLTSNWLVFCISTSYFASATVYSFAVSEGDCTGPVHTLLASEFTSNSLAGKPERVKLPIRTSTRCSLASCLPPLNSVSK